MDSTTTLTKLSTKSSRSLSTAPIIVQLDTDIGHVDEFPPSPTRPGVMTRALRRKKHLSIYRASAPVQSPVAEVAIEIPCVQRPQSMISPASEEEPIYPPTKPQMHNRSHSQPTHIRLGHPSRPYYSAIRKNMSRPNSPSANASMNSSRPASRSRPNSVAMEPSPSLGYLPHTPDTTDDDHTFMLPTTAHRPSSSRISFGFGGVGSSASALHSGFSVSGEMEMRMALAALARGTRQEASDFQFQETGRMQNSVSGRVRKLGRGLKDLIRRKHDTSQ
ncbi:hypothetical protein B0H13DRAFT_972774 [Mycena leptocephala]|jgi:hypothetical protein|nr:hypothetical protein B0H13DRAFT_972774 [Mycena leptocephala]